MKQKTNSSSSQLSDTLKQLYPLWLPESETCTAMLQVVRELKRAGYQPKMAILVAVWQHTT